ncbi:hypothetical protein Tco_1055904 [Tanacetum coccineum]|uniref:BTB domain-containing protein n=1 Tax=Tanacetum coccineum TaxID=301880 RepID=A0ABQ5H2X9_9ASTR
MSDWKPQCPRNLYVSVLVFYQEGTDSYEFLLDNKKCVVNANVFRTILDICLKVEGVNFTDVPDDVTTLTFLIRLGYKDPLYKHTNMFVDHMHQPWRTLAEIINKCLSRKTASNDKLRRSRIDILWGMFYRENVNYPKLIWEDLAYQIDHMKEKRLRHKIMPFPRFTKVIINHFLKQYNSLSTLMFQHYHTIKDDGILYRLKFVRIGKDYKEYGFSIRKTMLTEAIKQYESYQMFFKYFTGQIPPRRAEAMRKTSSKRRIKKIDTLSADDNIISDDPDTTLELGKSISKTKAEEAKAARQVHYHRVQHYYREQLNIIWLNASLIVSGLRCYTPVNGKITVVTLVRELCPHGKGRVMWRLFVVVGGHSLLRDKGRRCGFLATMLGLRYLGEPTKRRKSSKVTFDPLKNLKGVPSLTPEEQEAANIMQALKESKKTSKRQPGTRGSSEGTSTIPGVPDESTVISAPSSEGTVTKPGVPDKEKDITEENVILEKGSKQESEYSEEDKLDDEEKDDKEGDANDECGN